LLVISTDSYYGAGIHEYLKYINIPIAIYTELILLMMSSKPARNM